MRGSFVDFLDSMMIATEADDITTQVAEDTRSAMGNPNMTTQEDRNEDLTNTDDIFGQNEDRGNAGGDPNAENTPGDENTPDDPTETDDIFNQNNGENTDDPNLSQDQQEEAPKNPDEDLLFAKKNTIRDNMAQLYSIINGNIDSLTSSLNNLNDMGSLKVTNAVLTHLRNSKTYLYKTLTEDVATLEYDELLQRYITIKRVYDICIRMLETHFKEDRVDLKKKKN